MKADNLETFAKITNALQSIAIILATCVGGYWTYHIYDEKKALFEREKAEYDKLDSQRKAEAKREVVPILEVNQIKPDKDKIEKRTIIIDVSFNNTGNEDVSLKFENDLDFYVRQVSSISQDGQIEFIGEKRSIKFNYSDNVSIHAIKAVPGSSSMKLSAIQNVPRPGIYLIFFSVKAPEEKQKNNGTIVTYAAMKFVNIE